MQQLSKHHHKISQTTSFCEPKFSLPGAQKCSRDCLFIIILIKTECCRPHDLLIVTVEGALSSLKVVINTVELVPESKRFNIKAAF